MGFRLIAILFLFFFFYKYFFVDEKSGKVTISNESGKNELHRIGTRNFLRKRDSSRINLLLHFSVIFIIINFVIGFVR